MELTTSSSLEKGDQQEEEQPAAKHQRMDCSNTLTVLVGSEEKSFLVHTVWITKKSPFFATACSKEWKEGQKRVYTGEVTPGEPCAEITSKALQGSLKHNQAHVEFFLLADFLQDDELAKKLLLSLVGGLKQFGLSCLPSTSVIAYAYERTPGDSAPRELLVELYITLYSRGILIRKLETLPAGFVLDVTKRLLRVTPRTSLDTVEDFIKIKLGT